MLPWVTSSSSSPRRLLGYIIPPWVRDFSYNNFVFLPWFVNAAIMIRLRSVQHLYWRFMSGSLGRMGLRHTQWGSKCLSGLCHARPGTKRLPLQRVQIHAYRKFKSQGWWLKRKVKWSNERFWSCPEKLGWYMYWSSSLYLSSRLPRRKRVYPSVKALDPPLYPIGWEGCYQYNVLTREG